MRGFIIIGGDQKKSVCAGFLGMLTEIERGGGVVAAGAGNHFAPARYVGHAVIHQMDMFLHSEGGTFPCGAADTQRVHAGFQLTVHLPGKGGIVDGTRGLKGGNQSGTGASEQMCIRDRCGRPAG